MRPVRAGRRAAHPFDSSDRPDITVLLDKVTGFDLAQKKVFLEKKALDYDYLVLAMGGHTGYFGHPEWEQFAPGLKTLDDAMRIRSHILLAFEKAENETDPSEHDRLMTIVIVGGGPTGVELAGSFAELTRTVMNLDFRHIDPAQARVILLEGGPRILSHLPPDLVRKAKRQLNRSACRSRRDTQVKSIREGVVELANGEIIQAGNIRLGRRRCRHAAHQKARRANWTARTREGESRSEPAGPSGNFCHRRHGACVEAGRQTRSRRFTRRDADGQTRRQNHPADSMPDGANPRRARRSSIGTKARWRPLAVPPPSP